MNAASAIAYVDKLWQDRIGANESVAALERDILPLPLPVLTAVYNHLAPQAGLGEVSAFADSARAGARIITAWRSIYRSFAYPSSGVGTGERIDPLPAAESAPPTEEKEDREASYIRSPFAPNKQTRLRALFLERRGGWVPVGEMLTAVYGNDRNARISALHRVLAGVRIRVAETHIIERQGRGGNAMYRMIRKEAE